MTRTLHIVSGGAAQGLLKALQPRFEADHGVALSGTFGAVGLMKDHLLGGAPCDVLILTEALIRELGAAGQVVPASARAIGVVKTGLAVKSGAAAVDVATPEDLRRVLSAAGEIYFPDPAKATAGIHFMKVLVALGLVDALATRLRTFPNGATAMAALARSGDASAIGCTQVTEILHTPGVMLSGLLPAPHELATVYTAAVCTRSAEPGLAQALISVLSGADSAAARAGAGFE